MHEFADWSVGLGRWRGVPVRIHLLFVLFLVVLLVLASTRATFDIRFDSALAAAVMLFSVGIHEVAHVLMARRLGGWIHEIVIGPFGGLVRPNLPDVPLAHVIVALAGPIANLFCAIIVGSALAIYGGEPVAGLLIPFAPTSVIEGSSLVVALRLAVWLNWLLALANLLPVFPFDGAVAYRSALRPWLGGLTAATYVARGGFFAALGLIGLAWWSRSGGPSVTFPVWLPLLFAAVFVAFSAHRDSRRSYHARSDRTARLDSTGDLDDDWIDFEEDFEDEVPVASEAWRTGDDGKPWHPTDEDAEEAQLDDVLARLHSSGIDALSTEDRQLLERASRKYRSRLQRGTPEDA